MLCLGKKISNKILDRGFFTITYDHDFTWSGKGIDTNLTENLTFRFSNKCIAWSGDLDHCRNRLGPPG